MLLGASWAPALEIPPLKAGKGGATCVSKNGPCNASCVVLYVFMCSLMLLCMSSLFLRIFVRCGTVLRVLACFSMFLCSRGDLGRSWGTLGYSWDALGHSWGALGTLLGRSTALLGTLGRFWTVQKVPQTLQLPFKAPQKATQSVPKAFQEPCKGFKKLEISRRDCHISFLVS